MTSVDSGVLQCKLISYDNVSYVGLFFEVFRCFYTFLLRWILAEYYFLFHTERSRHRFWEIIGYEATGIPPLF